MAGTERRKTQAASFGAAAVTYERARPAYPDEAIDWSPRAATSSRCRRPVGPASWPVSSGCSTPTPGLAGAAEISMPYVTRGARAQLAP